MANSSFICCWAKYFLFSRDLKDESLGLGGMQSPSTSLISRTAGRKCLQPQIPQLLCLYGYDSPSAELMGLFCSTSEGWRPGNQTSRPGGFLLVALTRRCVDGQRRNPQQFAFLGRLNVSMSYRPAPSGSALEDAALQGQIVCFQWLSLSVKPHSLDEGFPEDAVD